MTRAESEQYFARYQDAFTALDFQAVRELWSFPAMIHSPMANWVLNEVDFDANTQGLCDFYARQGMDRVEAIVTDFSPLSENVASVRTQYVLFDKNNRKFIEWNHAYVLRDTGSDIRAISTICDGEVAAWEQRGTPLGS